jgi:hypothetical protein
MTVTDMHFLLMLEKNKGTLRHHLSIRVFIVYIDTESPELNVPSKSHGLADEISAIINFSDKKNYPDI